MPPISKKIRTEPIPTGHDAFSAVRRDFIKTIILTLLAPVWTVACERTDAKGRQGAAKMHINQNRAADNAVSSERTVPALDTRTPTVTQTATFAMG
jgi:hypothetical protein